MNTNYRLSLVRGFTDSSFRLKGFDFQKCLKSNTDKPVLSAAKMFSRKSTFWQHKVYAGIWIDSLDTGRQTK